MIDAGSGLRNLLAAVLLAGSLPSGLSAQMDAVFAGDPNRVCLGDGSGGFSCSDVSGDTHSTVDVALGFVDGDAIIDVVFANSGGPNRVCLGDGSGGFSCLDVGADIEFVQGVALGFVNDDPTLDAVFGGSPSQVCLGNGDGSFTCSDISGGHRSAPALGFLDEDETLDIVFSGNPVVSLGGPRFSVVCLGDGFGDFSCSDAEGGGSRVALGKIDADDHPDAVFIGRYNDTLDCSSQAVCLGDGHGDFSTCHHIAPACTTGVALGLVDEDSFLDAVFATGSGKEDEANLVCLGDGSGGFSCSEVSDDPNSFTDVALGQLDPPTILEVPTLGFAALISLAMLMALLGALRLRRRQGI